MKKLFDKVGKKREKEGSLVGKVVMVGQYSVKVEALVGEGGFATIYRCVDMKSGHAFALKHMRLGADSDAIKEVQQEAKTMARLKGHPNVLKLHAVAFAGPAGAETDGFMLLDFCPLTLLEVMQRSNFVLDDFLVYEVFQDVVWAVAHMHKCNPPLAHRDLKAENVLKNSEGRWVICDFGSSTARAQVYDTVAEIAVEEDNIRRTTTPAYRAPEMWDLYSRQRIDTAVDVWALGVLLYVLAFGKLPFQGDSKLSILYGKYDMPQGRPAAMRALIQDMLQVNPADRPDVFQIISKLDVLRTVLSSEPGVPSGNEALEAPPAPAVAAQIAVQAAAFQVASAAAHYQPQHHVQNVLGGQPQPHVNLQNSHPHQPALLQPYPAQPQLQPLARLGSGLPVEPALPPQHSTSQLGVNPQRAMPMQPPPPQALPLPPAAGVAPAQGPGLTLWPTGPPPPYALPHPHPHPQQPGPHAGAASAQQPHPYSAQQPGQQPHMPPGYMHQHMHSQPSPQHPGQPPPQPRHPPGLAPGIAPSRPPAMQRLPSHGHTGFSPSWPTASPSPQQQQPPPLAQSAPQLLNLMDEVVPEPTASALATPALVVVPSQQRHRRTGSNTATAAHAAVGFGDDNVDWGDQPAFGAPAASAGSSPPEQQQQQQLQQQHAAAEQPELMSSDSLTPLPGPSCGALPPAPRSAAYVNSSSSVSSSHGLVSSSPAAGSMPVSAATFAEASGVVSRNTAAALAAAGSHATAAGSAHIAVQGDVNNGAGATNESEALRAQLQRLSALNSQLEDRVRQLEGVVSSQGAVIQRLASDVRTLQQQPQGGNQSQSTNAPELGSAGSGGGSGSSGQALTAAAPAGGDTKGAVGGAASGDSNGSSFSGQQAQAGSSEVYEAEPWSSKPGEQPQSGGPYPPIYPPIRYEDLA